MRKIAGLYIDEVAIVVLLTLVTLGAIFVRFGPV